MRQAMMVATLKLLATQRLWTLKVSDIALACGVRPPLFYAYFNSVEEVIVALVDQANEDQPDIAALIDQPWTPENAQGLARKILSLSIEHWDKYRPVLKILHMLADDGQETFVRKRIERLRPMVQASERRVREAQSAGRLSAHLNHRLVSYALAMRIEQAGASWNLTMHSGAPIEELQETLAACHVAFVRGLKIYPALL